MSGSRRDRTMWLVVSAAAAATAAWSPVIAQTPCCPTDSECRFCSHVQSVEVVPDPYLPAEQDGTPRKVLAVTVSVCDSTDAEKVALCESRSVLVAADGPIAARLAYLPQYDGGSPWPADPRHFDARLLFTVPPEGLQPLQLRLVARRYKMCAITFEWAGGGEPLSPPLSSRSEGFSATLDRMVVGAEQEGGDPLNGEQHLQIGFKGRTLTADVEAPDTEWGALYVMTQDGATVRPDRTHIVAQRSRMSGGLYAEYSDAVYHFDSVRQLPLVASVTLLVTMWTPVEEHWSDLP